MYKEFIQLSSKKPPNHPIKKWTKDPNRNFCKEDIPMAYRNMKICSTSLIMREMHIKTTGRYHLTPVRVTTMKTRYNKSWWGCEEKGILSRYRWECKFVQLLWKTVWSFLKIWKIKLSWITSISRNPDFSILSCKFT